MYPLVVGRKGAVVATLGTEPQVLTLGVAALLERGEPLVRAVGLHSTAEERAIRQAVRALERVWPGLPFANKVALELVAVPIRDLDSEMALRIAYRTIRATLHALTAEGLRIHVNLAGGRKPLAVCVFIAAQFLLSPDDRVWYLYSSPELVQSRRFLPGPGEWVRLIELPLPLWTEQPVLLEALARHEDPWAAAALQRHMVRQEESLRWKTFLEWKLTPAERAVVRELLRGGTNKDIAARLGKSPRTVAHQLGSAFRKLREFLGLGSGEVDRTALAATLAAQLGPDSLHPVGQLPEDHTSENSYPLERR